jgi:hypothetical protein
VFGEGGSGEFEVGFEHLHGVAGAALLGLEDELDASGGYGGADTVAFVADDAEDVVGGNYRLCGGDDVEEESSAADLVEDLGALTFEAGAFAGGHDGDGEVWGGHRGYGLMLAVCRGWHKGSRVLVPDCRSIIALGCRPIRLRTILR